VYVNTYVCTYVRTYIHRYNNTYITYVHYMHIYVHTYVHLVKAHVGTYGNELADQLAKAAEQNRDTSISYNKITKWTLISAIEEEENKMTKPVE